MPCWAGRRGLADGLILDLHPNTANRARSTRSSAPRSRRPADPAGRPAGPARQGRAGPRRIAPPRPVAALGAQALGHHGVRPAGPLLGTPAAARTPMRMAGDGLTRAAWTRRASCWATWSASTGCCPWRSAGRGATAVLESTGQASAARDAVQALLGELPARSRRSRRWRRHWGWPRRPRPAGVPGSWNCVARRADCRASGATSCGSTTWPHCWLPRVTAAIARIQSATRPAPAPAAAAAGPRPAPGTGWCAAPGAGRAGHTARRMARARPRHAWGCRHCGR